MCFLKKFQSKYLKNITEKGIAYFGIKRTNNYNIEKFIENITSNASLN